MLKINSYSETPDKGVEKKGIKGMVFNIWGKNE